MSLNQRVLPEEEVTTSARKNESSLKGERWLRHTARVDFLRAVWALAAPLLAGLLFIPQAWWLAEVLQLTVHRHISENELLRFLLLIAAVLVVRAIMVGTGERCASVLAETIKHRLRIALLGQLLHRGPVWTRRHPSGEWATAVIDHVEALDGYLQRYMAAAVAAVFLPVLLAVAVFWVDWVVALLLLLTAPLIPLFMALVGWGAQAANQKYQQRLLQLAGVFGDRVKGLFTLSLFGGAQAEAQRVRAASVELGHTTMKVLRIAFLSSAVLELFAALGVAGVAVYIGLSYLGMLGPHFSGFSLQHGLFCLLIAPEVYQPLRQLAASYHDRAQAKSAVQELEQLFVSLPELTAELSTLAVGSNALPLDQGISIHPAASVTTEGMGLMPRVLSAKDVSWVVPDTFNTLIEPTSFVLRKNDAVALVGESGSGKTTLLEGLLGFRPRASGQIILHSAKATSVIKQTLVLEDVCYVGATPFVTVGTVAEVLRLASPTATDEQLWEALKAVQMAEFVQARAQGLETQVGNRGFGFSGGQIHRLALARLFLSDASLVLLDEPTAHLDEITRDAVLEAVLAYCKNRALVIATHDPVVAACMASTWYIENQVLHGVKP